MIGSQKGINFKHVGGQDMLLIHPETLIEYLKGLKRSESGWYAFRIETLNRLTHNNTFAKIFPIQKTEHAGAAEK